MLVLPVGLPQGGILVVAQVGTQLRVGTLSVLLAVPLLRKTPLVQCGLVRGEVARTAAQAIGTRG